MQRFAKRRTLIGAFACVFALIAPCRPASAQSEEFQVDQLAMKRIRVPGDLKIEVFAAEPLVLNPVAFCIDGKGKFYVAETFRLHSGVTDIRGHMDWLDDDLASRTVEDRVAMYRKYLGKDFPSYARDEDRVRLIWDSNGDGKADRTTVFADGFRDAADGIGAGVLTRNGDVWFTCIPDLWKLRDADGDGRADERTRLQHGYGVHVGFLGHDLHGLVFGPDGKIYFSIGDRGLNVQTPKGAVQSIDTGAVVRCEPDGSNLEIYASGLRNPQELVFDDFGNLFTVDNNSDSGDRARCVYLVEGGDSGWRIGYQFIEQPVSRGPWNAEKLWHPQWDGQAAFIVPPLINITDGPSGFCREPGTALSDAYRNRFFICDFRGGSGNSGIRSFRLAPKGASFEVVDANEFVWTVLATDADFGPDGALYFSDWVEGWEKPNKGRIYKLSPTKGTIHPRAAETAKLLAEDLSTRSIDQLVELLAFPDQRVRREAQFTLAEKGQASIAVLEKVAKDPSANQLARLHAVWALGQIQRKTSQGVAGLPELLAVKDAEIRAQAAKVLGDARMTSVVEGLKSMLADESPRVRFQAAIALGKLGGSSAFDSVLKMLEQNADKDPYLRHAGVMALAGSKDVTRLAGLSKSTSAAVRMAGLLALRRLQSPEISAFLGDSDARIVVETARAINDVPIPGAYERLADLGTAKGVDEPLLLRVLNANYRIGGARGARKIAEIALAENVAGTVREEALHELEHWSEPPVLDRVIGVWRPIAKRPMDDAATALAPSIGKLLLESPERLAITAARAAAALKIETAADSLVAAALDKKRPSKVRIEALKSIDALGDKRLGASVKAAVEDPSGDLRAEGLRLLAKLEPTETVGVLKQLIAKGSIREKQNAFMILQGVALPEVDVLLSEWVDKLVEDAVPAELQLDVLESASKHASHPELKAKLDRFEAKRKKDDPLAFYREVLEGGNAERGLAIFRENAQVQCLRCHKINGKGGEVGPDLTGIGNRQKREYLLESIVAPDKQIAKGFETIVIATKEGNVVSGILKSDDKDELKLMTAEGKLISVKKSDVEEQKRGPSAMPLDLLKFLSKTQLRDLVEFLASLQ